MSPRGLRHISRVKRAAARLRFLPIQEAALVDDPLFKQNVKVSEQQARQTVTDLYPGTIKEVEYEIETNGDSSYEIDVVDAEGTEWKVEVDAASGDIIETHIEQWEIGYEADEMVKISD
jgi:uncharacterized membrane protein YkoI